MSQRDRVLRLLQAAGPRGIHTFELRAAYVANPSQRVAELEEHGYKIRHVRERLRGDATGTRYTLIEVPVVDGETGRAAASVEPEKGDLAAATQTTLDIASSAPPPRLAIFDDWESAA